MNATEITKKIMKEYKICPKKRFGQNFLTDDEILKKIIDISKLKKNDQIIEIGPGLGNLTQYILEKKVNLTVFEIDREMKQILEKRFNTNKDLKIITKDILNVDIKDYIKNNKKTKIIANLPYYITTPIIFKLLENSQYIEQITIMIQKEVADRLIAKPHSKDYGVLTINTNYQADVIKEFDVPKESFIPSPNVTSSVIKIIPNELKKTRFGIADEKLFKEIISSSFANRRKTLINSLFISGKTNFEKNKIEEIITSLNINKNARAEELKISDFVKITNKIKASE